MSGERPFQSVMDTASGDMNNPEYRKYMEQKQALEGSYPEMVVAPLARSALSAMKPMTTLYRAEAPLSGTSNVSEWMKSSPEYQNMLKASGRWFTDDLAEAKWYLDDVQKGGNIFKVKIPKDQAEAMRLSNLPKGSSPLEYSRRPEKEFFIPKSIADTKKLYKD